MTKDAALAPLTVDALVRDYGALVWRTLLRYGVRDADVEDASQEVFVAVARHLPTFESRSSVATWLYSFARKTAARFRRRASTRNEVPTEDVACDLLVLALPDATFEAREQLVRLERILAELAPEPREAFVLFEIEGRSMADVAELLGCPLQTAYSRHRVAKEAVQAAFRRNDLVEQARTRGGTRA